MSQISPELTDASPLRRLAASLRPLFVVLGPLLALLLTFVLFAVVDRLQEGSWEFVSAYSFRKILKDASLVGVAALGMTLIIIAGGIDLSAGTATALCATVIAWCMVAGASPAVAILAGIATGCACGMLNGVLISTLGVVPFIVTLGTMTAFNGIGLILSRDSTIDAYDQTPEWVGNLQNLYPNPEWLGVCSGVWVMVGLALAVWVLLRFTVFGRWIFAVGANEEAARLCGINVVRVRIAVYALAGLFVGTAGLFQFAELSGQANPNQGTGLELDFIAAVVIGGGSLSGGRGSVLGTLVGACIMATIRHGCVTVDVSTSWQMVILGVIIVAAVTIDQFRQRRV